MALLSRSSLRGSVRRNPDPAHNDGQGPPMKKQRTLHDLWPRRRQSSPDCLDTTTPDESRSSGRARHANPPPLKPTRPRPSSRRTRRRSSSVDSIASDHQLATPGHPRVHGNGAVKKLRGSPDPLDMISPVAINPAPRARPDASASTADGAKPTISPTVARKARRGDLGGEGHSEASDTVKRESKHAALEKSAEPISVEATRSQRTLKGDQTAHEAPATVTERTGTERRSLRSADTAARCKSELAQYFHNYEQIISLEDPKPELLAAATIVTLVDDLPEPLPLSSTPNPTPFGNPLEKLYDCQAITLPEPASSSLGIDPLNEELYFKAHRKFERQEKQLRNIERDRAQHEKQHVERLLDELRGQDWLRVMGLVGVHDSEKKLYEPKRQILMDELVALVTKFQVWRDEERKRKLAKEKNLPVADAEAESHAPSRHSRKRSRAAEELDEDSSPLPPTPSTPDPSDVDAWAARQLHQETRSAFDAKRRKSVSESRKPRPNRPDDDDLAASANETKSSAKRPKNPPVTQPARSPSPPAPVPIFYPPPPDKPFTSFFEHPHLREMALADASGPRSDRTHTLLAFGHPMPSTEERDFEPPAELITDEAIQSSQRQRRRLKRRSGVN
ncbi:hypothetical protein N7462_011448 [Penicillium macrosclerotiorum]|uniref:uncharacterized protein n=1 Tax=Penicillium macrosclerotiorum TaxID=303699 RepID=UPI002546EF60|nr:uncharacterized protein N7462_011448 [Penicillium macrosclerotiorum]KAJ5664635.1 hypothetical protein N7462_011448 [Penicillium macrosclerotiorum]